MESICLSAFEALDFDPVPKPLRLIIPPQSETSADTYEPKSQKGLTPCQSTESKRHPPYDEIQWGEKSPNDNSDRVRKEWVFHQFTLNPFDQKIPWIKTQITNYGKGESQ